MLGCNTIKVSLFVSMLVLLGFSLGANAACNFVSTKDGSPLAIKPTAEDTPEAKVFLATCVNPYTKIFAADPAEAKKGKKIYDFNGCTGCHGGGLQGVMAPALSKDSRLNGVGQYGAWNAAWVYVKNATDKGMFETIAGGTPGISGGTMYTWHKQLPDHFGDGLSTDEILKAIAYIRSKYNGDPKERPWLSEKPQ